MKPVRTQDLIAAAIAGALAITSAHAQKPPAGAKPTPGFNTKIPPKIMTPDTVETRIGTLKFVDGVPTAETTQKASTTTSTSCAASRCSSTSSPPRPWKRCAAASVARGATKCQPGHHLRPAAGFQPAAASRATPTPSTASAFLDLETDGPTVVEIPPGCGPGTVNDAFFRFVIDMGTPARTRARAAST